MSDASNEWLSAALEAELLRHVEIEWRGINYRYFKSVLRRPVVRLVDESDTLVAWQAPLRELELSRTGALRRSWGELVEALKRAIVWQYVDEQLAVVPRDRHPAYRRICRHLGVDDLAHASTRADATSHRLVTRIDKLLALARSPNQHEAETAAATARRLMLKFNQNPAASRPTRDAAGPTDRSDSDLRFNVAHTHAHEREHEAYRYRQLGPPRGRLREHDRRLADILTSYFFVESAWMPIYLPREGRRATMLEICGLEANLLMAEHVHAFLRHTSVRLWSEYTAERSVPARERPAFLAGVMAGFERKLAAQDEQLRAEGLVWVPAPGLGEFFRRRNPQLRLRQVGNGQWSTAYEQGRRAGQTIVLSQPLSSSSTRAGVRLALRP